MTGAKYKRDEEIKKEKEMGEKRQMGQREERKKKTLGTQNDTCGITHRPHTSHTHTVEQTKTQGHQKTNTLNFSFCPSDSSSV